MRFAFVLIFAIFQGINVECPEDIVFFFSTAPTLWSFCFLDTVICLSKKNVLIYQRVLRLFAHADFCQFFTERQKGEKLPLSDFFAQVVCHLKANVSFIRMYVLFFSHSKFGLFPGH